MVQDEIFENDFEEKDMRAEKSKKVLIIVIILMLFAGTYYYYGNSSKIKVAPRFVD